jgi:C4-dicarboxylate transporter DctM subunit
MTFIMSNAHFSEQIVLFLSHYMVNKTLYLIAVMVILFLVGCLFDTVPAIILLAPLIVPTGLAMGVDPLHLGVLFVVNLVVGFVTPPFGINIFTAIAISELEFSEVVKGCLPFLAMEIVAVVIIAFCPWMVTWLPGILQ